MRKFIWTGFLLSVLAASAAHAQSKPTPEQLSRFFDRTVPALMEQHHVVGVVVGVTDGSDTLFSSGYGNANLDKDTPVDPNMTLFRAGSISKLFTWTAIMQLEEQGKLDLDDPVEKYLDFDLPDTFEEPVRIIDLMNHTPGFEDRKEDGSLNIEAFVDNVRNRVRKLQAHFSQATTDRTVLCTRCCASRFSI